MKKMLLAVMVVAGMIVAGFAAEKPDPNNIRIRAPFEYEARGGLPNFYAKVNAGESVKIAYFGGSITEQNGWRPQNLAYFRKTFPGTRFTEVHAAIGGTSSDLGAFRIDRDVLMHKPDLVFVEFAVNDNGMRPGSIIRSMEGIVRHIWTVLPETDICFVYTATVRDQKNLLEGKTKLSTSTHEAVAEYYRIPSVWLPADVLKLLKQDKLIMKVPRTEMLQPSGEALDKLAQMPHDRNGRIVFSNDGVHPFPNTGHVLYTDVLTRALPEIAKAGTPAPHRPLPEAIVPDSLVQTCTVSPGSPLVTLSGTTEKLPFTAPEAKCFTGRADGVWQLSPGAEAKLKFQGSRVMLYVVYGPGSGMADISIDGKTVLNQRKFFDAYCSYFRIATVPVADHLAPEKTHEIIVRALPDKWDKRMQIMESRRNEFDRNPKRYEANNLYLAGFFLVGKPVK